MLESLATVARQRCYCVQFFNSSPALANSRVIVGVDVTLATTLYKMVDVNGIHRAYLELIAVSTKNFLLLG